MGHNCVRAKNHGLKLKTLKRENAEEGHSCFGMLERSWGTFPKVSFKPMTLYHTPGMIKRFWRTPWKFQQTFHTPLKNLAPFVAAIVSAIEPLRGGTVTIASVVYDDPVELRYLSPLLAEHGTSSPLFHPDWSIEAANGEEIQTLLLAAFSDFINFIFIPNPSRFSIYADHEEYATFFAHAKSNLNSVVSPLTGQGFTPVDYQRVLTGRM